MEFSSPLAAMQPPPRPPRGLGCGAQDLSVSRGLFPTANAFGSNSFNFKDLSMKRSNGDYFSLKPVRGSSPTASLAADLSQNFHIDQSPQLPTPRRSLFTSNIFQSPVRWAGVTTPPILSSSPGMGNDSMDISPLPHKVPFSRADVQSPSPESPPVDQDMPSFCESPVASSLDVPKPAPAVERRKPALRRPSLSRTKGYSTNTVSLKSNAMENTLPTFTFGAGSSGVVESPSLSLSECFEESPGQTRTVSLNLAGGPSRSRQLSNFNNSLRGNGSPCQVQCRRPHGVPARPRKQFRRSLSMFEHPDDVMKQEQTGCSPSTLQSIMDVDDDRNPLLPSFVPEGEPRDSIPRLSLDTLVDVLDGQYSQIYDNVCIVDCRFEYEYEGGHIQGAVNHNDKELLAEKLFSSPTTHKTLLVFHCEYSAHRAPIMARFVRQRDRAVNDFRYPQLTYPEVYLLDGGYSAFFKSHRTRCYPQNYVEMDAKEHEHACELGMNKLRQRAKLSRAHTFAIGQTCQQENSPTSQCRTRPKDLLDDTMLGNTFDPRRLHARRMASY